MNIPDTAGDLCTREVTVAAPQVAVDAAAQLMRQRHVGCLIVVAAPGSDATPVGMLTDRDIVTAIVARGVAPQRLQVADVMSTDLVTVGEGDSVSDALLQMRRRGVRRLPVLDGRGQLAGLLTLDDLLDFVAGQLQALVAVIGREQRQELRGRP